MRPLFRLLLPAAFGLFAATPAFADGPKPEPMPTPYRTPPSPMPPIPGPCPPPHTDKEDAGNPPRPVPYVPDIRVSPMAPRTH